MAVTSKRLKGTYIKGLKEAAANMEEAVRVLVDRMDTSEEVQRLSAQNKRMHGELAEMRETISSIREERDSVQAKMDRVARENTRMKGEMEALHEDLKNLRREQMSHRLAPLKALATTADPPPLPETAVEEPPPLPQREARRRRAKPLPAPPRNSSPESDGGMDVSPSREKVHDGGRESPIPLRDQGTQPNVEDVHLGVCPSEFKDTKSLLREHTRMVDKMITERLDKFFQAFMDRQLRPALGANPQKRTEAPDQGMTGSSSQAALSVATATPMPPTQETGTAAKAKKTGAKKKKKGAKKKDGAGQQPGTGTVAKATPRPSTQKPSAPATSSQPSDPTTSKDTWSQVVGRKKKLAPQGTSLKPLSGQGGDKGRAGAKTGTAKATGPPKPKLGRPPRSAAVVLSAPEGAKSDFLGEVLRYVREKVPLEGFGIPDVRPRRALTGALILEIPGKDSDAKAEELYKAILPLVVEKGGRLTRPVKTVELRVRGLDESISQSEVQETVATVGGCAVAAVKVGQPRASPGGLSTAWIQCPLAAAQKVVAAGALKIGWVRAPVEILERRPLQCHRCLRRGHVTNACPHTAPEEDRRGRCYNCGDRGHRVSTCTSAPKCPLCSDLGLPANHRLGGKACAPTPSKGKKRRAPKAAGPTSGTQLARGTESPAGEQSSPATQGVAVSVTAQDAVTQSSEGIAPPSPPASRALEEEAMDIA
ncbi:uncharacterized protein LOC109862322 [Pseudomyrmex gracilis]|uniref:uncharacterized protein LOC109862322 n=1 Tax=Pseudomyrmex gracilis TaxID=219809 RepID=UPI000995A61C|nr:uncharacterized protein LOC109862322 [Pseudomyrmex gracilis]